MNKRTKTRVIAIVVSFWAVVLVVVGIYFLGINAGNAKEDFKDDCRKAGFRPLEIGPELLCVDGEREVVRQK